ANSFCASVLYLYEVHIIPTSAVNETIMPRMGYTILAVIMGFFSVFGIILNITVIVLALKHRQLRQPLNFTLVNLAVDDLGCATFGGLPTMVTNAMEYLSLSRVGCVLEGFGIAGLCPATIIAVERCMVVCRPVAPVTFQVRHAVAGIAGIGWGSYELEGVQTSCAPDWYIIVISYTRLLWTLQQVGNSGKLHTARAETQATCTVVVMVMAFLLTLLPYAAFALSVILDPNLYIDPVIATIPMYLAKSSTVFNPIIYIFMNRQVRPYLLECIAINLKIRPTIDMTQNTFSVSVRKACCAVLCGRNLWATEPAGSEEETTVSSVSRSNKVSPS
uniref:Parapinopsin a n=1 Tax=Cyprinus carpio TaxID=7962 RepID=A0A8C1N6K0_CYPCA